MGAVYFYHLTQRPLEATLPVLLEKSRAVGWRVLVRGAEPSRLEWLDRILWQGGPQEGFLPHGIAGGAHDADQPVLLSCESTPIMDRAANGAACLMAIDGAEVSPAEVGALERVCVLFDGNDEAALARARSQWKTLADAGCAAQYWSEDSGQWQKKAETAASQAPS